MADFSPRSSTGTDWPLSVVKSLLLSPLRPADSVFLTFDWAFNFIESFQFFLFSYSLILFLTPIPLFLGWCPLRPLNLILRSFPQCLHGSQSCGDFLKFEAIPPPFFWYMSGGGNFPMLGCRTYSTFDGRSGESFLISFCGRLNLREPMACFSLRQVCLFPICILREAYSLP